MRKKNGEVNKKNYSLMMKKKKKKRGERDFVDMATSIYPYSSTFSLSLPHKHTHIHTYVEIFTLPPLHDALLRLPRVYRHRSALASLYTSSRLSYLLRAPFSSSLSLCRTQAGKGVCVSLLLRCC